MKRYLPILFIAASLLAGCSGSGDRSGNSDTADVRTDSAAIKTWDSLKNVRQPGEMVTPDPVSVERIPVEVSEDVLERYTGTYKLLLDSSNVFRVSVSLGELYFTGLQDIPVRFYAENDTAFFHDPASTETLAFKKRGDYYNMILINRKGYVLEARRIP